MKVYNLCGMKQVSYLVLLLLGFFSILSIPFVLSISPFGAQLTDLGSETAPQDVAGSHEAYAGNVTDLNVYGYSTTQTWQGYFGNISGTVQLADASDNVMYNWTLANPRGEVYASKNNTILWYYAQCFNFTADGTYASDTAQAGSTSLFGTNYTLLEMEYNINYTDVDGVNETFVLEGVGGHENFYTSSLQFSSGECRSTRVYDSTGTGVAQNFEEALLYEPTTTSVIFTSLINKDVLGFDQRTHDFEMLVLEDGHGTNIASTPYYFFVELE